MTIYIDPVTVNPTNGIDGFVILSHYDIAGPDMIKAAKYPQGRYPI